MDDLIGKTIGGCEIIKPLGSGGAATVYLATQQSLNRDVALKILSPEKLQDQSSIERFIREAQIAAKLGHENIVQIHDAGVDGSFYYIVMEYIEGDTLEEYLRIRGSVNLARAVEIIVSVAEALEYAWSEGTIHRDIKPSNILLTREGKVRLTDFGLVKNVRESANLTQEGLALGTPAYMSPEQIRGAHLDFRSDVYSLGLLFYEMVTGTQLYSGNTTQIISAKLSDIRILKPTSVREGLPNRLDHIVALMTATERDNRFGSYQEMVASLKRLSGGVMKKRRAVPVPDKRRAPLIAGIILILIIILAVTAFVMLVMRPA